MPPLPPRWLPRCPVQERVMPRAFLNIHAWWRVLCSRAPTEQTTASCSTRIAVVLSPLCLYSYARTTSRARARLCRRCYAATTRAEAGQRRGAAVAAVCVHAAVASQRGMGARRRLPRQTRARAQQPDARRRGARRFCRLEEEPAAERDRGRACGGEGAPRRLAVALQPTASECMR